MLYNGSFFLFFNFSSRNFADGIEIFFKNSGRKSSWLHLMLGVVEVEEVSAFCNCNAKPNRVPVAKNKGNKDKKIGVKSTVIIAFWQEPMN